MPILERINNKGSALSEPFGAERSRSTHGESKGFTLISLPSLRERSCQGFTLIELLVVIAILAILSTISISVFRGAQKSARDAVRKQAVESISKSYESGYDYGSGNYQPLSASDFPQGTPAPPEGGNYEGLITTPASYYQVCAALEDHPTRTCDTPRSTCYCKSSLRISSSGGSGSGGSGGSGGGSLNHPESCDPYGTLDDGLAGYWKMDSNANDSTGVNNGSWGGTEAYDTGVTSLFDKAGSLNGSGYISVADNGSLSLTNNITVSVWVKWNGRRPDEQQRPDGTWVSGQTILTHTGKGNDPCNSYVLYLDSVNQLSFLKECTFDGVSSYFTASANTWYHIVSTYNGSERKIYINTTPKGGPRGSAPTFVNGNILTIGAQRNTGGTYQAYWNGFIDDVRIYNRALSEEEVKKLYSSGSGCIPPS